MIAAARRLGRPALLLAGLVLVALVLRAGPNALLAAGGGDRDSPLDLLGFAAAGAVLCAAGLPRQLVAYAAGLAFGAWGGGALALVAQFAGCVLDLFWARVVARDWVLARLRGRLARADRLLAANPFSATLTLRLLPVGNNLALNLLAGVSSVPAGRFLAASLVGYMPQTVVFALLGAGARPAHNADIGLGVALFLASVTSGLVLLRRTRVGRAEMVNEAASDARYGESRPG